MVSQWLLAAGVVGLAYLLGSIPTGFWFGKLRGVDIRTVGSGNIGATNIQRTFGTGAAVLVLLVDVGKGFVAAFFLSRLTAFPQADILRVSCGLAAILGHTFTLFLNFKGGKGVATTYGVLLGLAPLTTITVFVVFVGVVAITRYISAGSLVSAALFPLVVWFYHEVGAYASIFILACCIGLVIIVRHWANIGRILRGEENRLGQKVTMKPKAS